MTRILISAFLLFHLIAITFWCVPLNSALVSSVKDLVRPYMFWSGLFQGWDMFAPTPPNVNAYVEAAVIYKDGTHQMWNFPRMDQLGLVERYYRERYRKFVENLRQDANAALWPDVARRIACLNNTHPANPPEIIILVRYWSDIPKPGAREKTQERGRLQGNIFYEYNVKPEDLR